MERHRRRGEAYTHQTHHPLTDCLCLTDWRLHRARSERGPSVGPRRKRGGKCVGDDDAADFRKLIGKPRTIDCVHFGPRSPNRPTQVKTVITFLGI